MKLSIRHNIGLDYSFTFLNNLNLLHALWMIWLSLKGFSLWELGLLEGIFHATSFLMEVPTGAVADLWGRRSSRILGRIFFMASLFFLWKAEGFLFQAAGFVLIAFSYNLESGAGEALVYDSLVHIKKEELFMGVRGKKELIFQLAAITAFLSGGYLATRDYNLVFAVTLLAALLSVGNALLMTEPPLKSRQIPPEGSIIKRAARSLGGQTKNSLSVIRKEPRIAYLIIYSECIFVFTTTQYFYLQTWWKFAGYSEFYMGIVFSFQCFLAGLSALAAPGLDKRFGEKKLLFIIPVLLLISLWGVALFQFKALFFILNGVFEGILMVSISDYINKMIPSDYRATILSYQSMVFSFLMILLFPLIGLLGDLFSLDVSFFVISSIGTALFVLYRIYIRFYQKRNT